MIIYIYGQRSTGNDLLLTERHTTARWKRLWDTSYCWWTRNRAGLAASERVRKTSGNLSYSLILEVIVKNGQTSLINLSLESFNVKGGNVDHVIKLLWFMLV